MRWIKFSAGGPEVHGPEAYGIIEGDEIAEVSGTPFGEHARIGRRHRLDAVRIEIPVIPRTFYCVGLNYTAHLEKEAARLGTTPKFPTKPDIGYRAVNALAAHGADVVVPADATELVQNEAELVVVIGKKAKNLSETEALSCVLGYSIGNDVSERSWQNSDRTLWRSKNTDTFKPMGPWIETGVDLDSMQTVVHVNGVETNRFATNDMLFGIATYIAAMSRYMTLYPTDVIWMGTNDSSPNLKDGDLVDIDITGIGRLRNRFVIDRA